MRISGFVVGALSHKFVKTNVIVLTLVSVALAPGTFPVLLRTLLLRSLTSSTLRVHSVLHTTQLSHQIISFDVSLVTVIRRNSASKPFTVI